MQERVTGAPLTAEQRPLFFKHAQRVPKGDLTEDQHSRLVAFEQARAVRHEQEWWEQHPLRLWLQLGLVFVQTYCGRTGTNP